MTEPDDDDGGNRDDGNDGKEEEWDRRFPRARKGFQCVYECLGAPVLLYRAWDDRYSLLDEEGGPASLPGWKVRPEPRLRDLLGRGRRLPPHKRRKSGPVLSAMAVHRRSRALLDELRRLRRSQSRWYLPMDYHVLRPQMPRLDNLHVPAPVVLPAWKRPSRESHEVGDDDDDSGEDDSGGDDGNALDYKDIDWSYYKQRSFLMMEESRANQLLAPLRGRRLGGEELAATETEEEEEQRCWSVLRSHQRYDRNWVLEDDYRRKAQRGLCRMHDQQRMDGSDPSYLAPFSLDALERSQLRCSQFGTEELFDWPLDDPNDPHDCGNTLIVVPCQCSHCSGGESEKTWFLMHPCGPLLEHVGLSCLQFPIDNAAPAGTDNDSGRRGTGSSEALDVDDTVRQLVQCGTATYVARTRIHCVVFSVRFEVGSTTAGCGRRGTLTVLHKIDLRTLARDVPYYIPVHVARHPRYGNAFVDPMIAILLQDENSVLPNNNTIERAHPGKFSVRRETHVITNLLEITDMDFSAHHPMVLWSAARPYDQPAVKPTLQGSASPLGLGCSLYSIDLRTNEGTFQWSPSHEMYAVDGVHSISAVHTDWKTEHTLWVASESARRTWEIDARMPVKTVSSWSTPHILDAGPDLQFIPNMGVYGAGILLTQPERDPATCHPLDGVGASSSRPSGGDGGRVESETATKPYPMPVLATSLNPLAYGIHVYQRPTVHPLHEFKSLEARATPELARQTHMCVAVSSAFPFCDASDRTFTCGLASVCVPVSKFLNRDEVEKLGYQESDLRSVMCAFTMTNRGDVYSHNLLESHAEHVRGVAHNDLPLGASAVALPDDVTSLRSSFAVASRPGLLYVPLSNDYPVPGLALTVSPAVDFPVTDLARESERYSSRVHSADGAATSTARWTATSHYVVQKADINDSPSELILPFDSVALHNAIDEQLAKTLARYDHQSDAAQVVERDEESYHCDVTKSFAALATQAWPSLDDLDDDSNLL